MENNPYVKKSLICCVCINSLAVIALLISGLIIGSIDGKDDPTSINLLISFAVIFGNMAFLAIFCLMIGICCQAIKKKEELTIAV